MESIGAECSASGCDGMGGAGIGVEVLVVVMKEQEGERWERRKRVVAIVRLGVHPTG